MKTINDFEKEILDFLKKSLKHSQYEYAMAFCESGKLPFLGATKVNVENLINEEPMEKVLQFFSSLILKTANLFYYDKISTDTENVSEIVELNLIGSASSLYLFILILKEKAKKDKNYFWNEALSDKFSEIIETYKKFVEILIDLQTNMHAYMIKAEDMVEE